MYKVLIISEDKKNLKKIKSYYNFNNEKYYNKIDISVDIKESINLIRQSLKIDEYRVILVPGLNFFEKHFTFLDKIYNMDFKIKPVLVLYDINNIIENKEQGKELVNLCNISENEKYLNTGKANVDQYLKCVIETIQDKRSLKANLYIFEAVKICLEDYQMIFDISKVYGAVGEKFNTSSMTVERAIRTLINKGWNKDKLIKFCDFTNNSYYTKRATNHAFISGIVIACQKNCKDYK